VSRRDYVYEVFERQSEIAVANLAKLQQAVGDKVKVAFLTGTDFGTQNGPFISPQAYRDLFMPFHKKLTGWIHEHTKWKTFMHSCGSVTPLVEHFIEAGVDILNPVQCSAADMDPRELKKRFGGRIVFWGAGVNTQHTLAFGTADDVREEVKQRLEIFGEGGGFVFNPIHNVQANTPVENVVAMFETVKKCR
jgi:uroporphyrinogen-III decarboxylase